MNSQEIRQKYIQFFESKGHKAIPSASLVPEGDATTLFTGSGMQPLVPYLLGQAHPQGKLLVNSQKSFRAEDITEVGDNRHTTFFEMLGNWSLGEYFKDQQLPWVFEFMTQEVGLDPSKLYVSVFSGMEQYGIPKDDESIAIWNKLFAGKGITAEYVELVTEEDGAKTGMQGGRIFGYARNNWWSRSGPPENMPANEPGGPDSELFYDFGTAHDPAFGAECHPNCDCGRFLEIGNSVFMEYLKTDSGFEKLKQRNVDFGGGLERMAAASINNPDVFQIDSFTGAMGEIQSLAKTEGIFSRRVIADHLRAAVFLISDGVIPSNKDRGYVLRRLIRRAITYGRKLGIEENFIVRVAAHFITYYEGTFPALQNRQAILAELLKEEKKFASTLSAGLKIIEGKDSLSGKEAFDLFQSFGFPWELTRELIRDKSRLTEIESEFKAEMEKHQALSKTASAGMFKGGLASHSDRIIRLHTVTHLLNAALRKVLGTEVWQKGSNITEERTRFDFTHGAKMTDEQKAEVEKLVNGWIEADFPVKKEIMSRDDAQKLGAIGVFGEKYADEVSVYSAVDSKTGEAVSREFCGGPHVERTGSIGKFRITKEEAVSAGVRRIKATVD